MARGSMYGDNQKNRKRLPLRKQWNIALSAAIAMSCGPVWATAVDCQIALQSAFVGDIHGDGTNALFLVYTYTASSGTIENCVIE